MKKFSTYIITGIFFLALFFSCKKELSFEEGQRSTGYIIKTINGDCQPTMAYGSFVAGSQVDNSNNLEVDVNVTSPGAYLIETETVNGYSFRSSGSFNSTGIVTVRLSGTGKPINQGTDLFTVSFDTSFCIAAIEVSGNSNGLASYNFPGAPGNCLNAIASGDYIKNTDVDTSNYVIINVNVTVPGTYAITTNALNGYFFSAAGAFTNTGAHSVKLFASGIPGVAGTDQFTIQDSGSSCKFPVTVHDALRVTSNDYFPMTKGSYWTFDYSENPGDSLKRVVNDTANKEGNQYTTMYELLPTTGINELYFRKAGLSYYEYTRVDKYTESFTYGPQLYGDILFLKEGISTNEVWYSKEFSGTASFGQVILLRYQYTCTNANAGVNINGKVFANVYKIRMIPQIRSLTADYGHTGETYDYYYAKGVGLVYAKKVTNGFRKFEQKLDKWFVN